MPASDLSLVLTTAGKCRQLTALSRVALWELPSVEDPQLIQGYRRFSPWGKSAFNALAYRGGWGQGRASLKDLPSFRSYCDCFTVLCSLPIPISSFPMTLTLRAFPDKTSARKSPSQSQLLGSYLRHQT